MEGIFKKKIWILILGFFLRIGFILSLENKFYFDDEFEYFKIVENFLKGNGFIISEKLKSFRPPLYPFILTIFKLLNIDIFGIRLFQVFISTFTIYIIYLIGKETFDEKVGLLSAFVSAIYPFFIFYTGFLLTETLFIFLVTLTVFFILKIVENNGKISFKSGILLGLGGLTRPILQLYLPIVCFHILNLKENLTLRFKKIIFLFIGFFLSLSPWIIRNFKIFHKFVPGTTMGGWVFWEGNNPYSKGGPCSYFPEGILEIDELKRDKLLYKMTLEVIRSNPKRFLWLLQNKFKRFWNVVPNAPEFREKFLYRFISLFSFGIMMPFFITGFFITLKNKKAQFLHSLIVFFTIFHMLFLSSIRYRLPIEPFYIIFSMHSLLQLTKLTKRCLSRGYK